MERIERFSVPDSLDLQGVLDGISETWSTVGDGTGGGEQRFYDTFDWRLYAKGLSLVEEGAAYHLRSLQTEANVAFLPWTAKGRPAFWWDFPDGGLKDELRSYLSVRALLPQASVKQRVQRVRVLNEDEKTVLRVRLEETRVLDDGREDRAFHTVALQPVRGYRRELRRFKKQIRELGITQDFEGIFQAALNAVGKTPGGYSSKLDISLDPASTARQAAGEILRRLSRTIRQNEAGVRADIDTEFLHDLRVSVRRTRSALSQIKGVFPAEAVDRFRRDFSYVGKLTNRVRDLDVYLLKREAYMALLPGPLRSGVDMLFQHLSEEREGAFRKMAKALDGAAYREVMAAWEDFLEPARVEAYGRTANSDRSAVGLAKKTIGKRYRKVVDSGRKIGDTTPDEDLHTLRIECKKLRYLLEFFASLFPPEEVSVSIAQLKKLQDNLGDFNDLSVQQGELNSYLEQLVPGRAESLKIAASVGGLIARLYQRQQALRMDFARTFGHFSGGKNAELFRKLFGKM